VIKNDSPEGSRLPEQANILTSIYKFTSEFINPSAINFDLKPEEPELPWEEGLQDRRG